MSFPSEIEKRIIEVTNFNEMELGTYINNVKKLSNYFIKGKFEKNYFSDKNYLNAYLLFYFPQNYCKIYKLLSILDNIMGFDDNITIFDFGGGPGNSLLGAIKYFNKRVNNVYYNEIQREVINIFEKNFLIFSKIKDVKINKEPDNCVDIYIFSYVLTELGTKIFNILNKLKKYESKNATYVFLSPPTKTTLKLHTKIREKFDKRGFNTIYPCRAKKCPVLNLTREKESLCFSQFYWEIPEIVKKINSKLYFKIKYLKSSILVLSKKSLNKDYIFPLSPSIIRKGKTEAYFCTPNGRKLFELLKRDESEKNKPFKSIIRGIPVKIEPLPSKRLNKDTFVEIL